MKPDVKGIINNLHQSLGVDSTKACSVENEEGIRILSACLSAVCRLPLSRVGNFL